MSTNRPARHGPRDVSGTRRAGIVLAALLGLTSCGSANPASAPTSADTAKPALAAKGSTAAAATATTSSEPSTQAPPAPTIETDDLAAGYQISTLEQGDEVKGQVTLDLCAATFTSEAHRRTRHQIVVSDPAGTQIFSVESVTYDSVASAELAMTELRHAIKTCPNGFRPSPIANEPELRVTFLPDPDQTWSPAPAGVDRISSAQHAEDRQGNYIDTIAVYQQRNATLVGFYGPTDIDLNPAFAPGRNGLPGMIQTLAERLAAN